MSGGQLSCLIRRPHPFTRSSRASSEPLQLFSALRSRAAPVQNEADIEAAVAAFAREPNGGLIVAADAFNAVNRALIMTSVERQQLPAIYYLRQAVAEGGLMSYGPDTADIVRRSASYVDRILKGANPADLPVQQPIKFELAINLKAAKALNLKFPMTLLARADEVIE